MAPDLAVKVALSVAVLGLSVLTVLRYTVDYLQADGVQQSVMSVQDVDLFFWGQNRLPHSSLRWPAPVADPETNLFVCLVVNAIAFHVFLLLVASMGTSLVSGTRSVAATAVTFLVLGSLATSSSLQQRSTSWPSRVSRTWSFTLGAFPAMEEE